MQWLHIFSTRSSFVELFLFGHLNLSTYTCNPVSEGFFQAESIIISTLPPLAGFVHDREIG